MAFLSVVIITRNEEKNIHGCISSVLPVADEIIVVDSLSTDDTVKIATQLGARVILQSFLGYVEQKNFALQACSGTYVLSLDADEQLDAKALQAIKHEKENNFPASGYYFKRCTFVGQRPVTKGSWYPDKKLRLVKKEEALWAGINPHDTLTIQSSNTKTLEGNILHYSYKNAEELFIKTQKYAAISAEHLFRLGKTIHPMMIPIKAYTRFFKHYILKGGCFEGKLGWLIGKQQYFEALWKYRQLLQLHRQAKQQP